MVGDMGIELELGAAHPGLVDVENVLRRHRDEGDEEEMAYQTFVTFEEAKKYALSFVSSNPRFECAIYNSNGDAVVTFTSAGERKYL